MLRYRSFRNTDPPRIIEIWQSLAGQPGLYQPLSIDLLEQIVMSRLYFEPEGLILAWDDDRPVGMAHAGFGPSEEENWINTELGTTCVLLVRSDCDRQEVASGLLERTEAYLVERGTKVIYGGGIRPLNPYYLGLYGGSELPGILASDTLACETFTSHDYREIDRTVIFQCQLRNFHVAFNRRLMQIRRQMIVHTTVDPPWRNWWEGCTLGNFELTRFSLHPRLGGPPVAHALVRNIDQTGVFGGGRSAGLVELEVDPRHRRRGLVTFLLSEIIHQLGRHGITQLEVQTMRENSAALALYQRLGFQKVDEGIVFRKNASFS